ncbi:MAG: DUF4294 domain-containing protein [Bacteroidales bacterium]|nr:DUF4294 domain-containing protein [Bacteroidales bacterium]
MRPLQFVIILAFIITGGMLYAQDTINLSDKYVLLGIIQDGDTILISSIDEVIFFKSHKFNTRREWRRYHRLVRHVKKVYPFAKMAGEKYDIVAKNMLSLETDKERRQYIKQVEKEIMDEFEDDIRDLTMTQGRILLKLIDREIGETSYDLLKELKGSFTAVFWQTLARIFGQNLKSEFDPDGEDKLLNEIVILIENGQL